MKAQTLTSFMWLLCLFLLSGCEGTRPLTYAQGTGDNLFLISDFDGRSFEQSTGGVRFRGRTSRADELVTIDGYDGINNLDAVDLKFAEGLFAKVNLNDLIFYGKPDHVYAFRYQLTDDYLILNVEAAKDDIPSQELTYATELSDGRYAAPLVGLPIQLVAVDVVRDPRGRDTRQKNEYEKDFKRDATHFRVDYGSIKYFSATSKQDLFTAAFFDPNDEWFYTKTLVGRPIDSRAILGETINALKVKFARTNNSIIGVDLNIADEQDVLDPTKTITVLEFPVEWVDYRMETSGSNAFLNELKLGNENPESRLWSERQYGLIDFNNADRLDKAFTLDNKLEKLEVGESYLSFNIYESGTGNTYKYSLAKDNRDIVGQRFPEDDALRFHIFKEKKTVLGGNAFVQKPDIESIVFANRFFPPDDNPEIVYHLSDNTPDLPEFVEAARAAVEAWDNAFREAGTKIRVRFSDERVALGDVRYNQIVLYGYEINSLLDSGGMLLGFGPSLQDTRTGRTYSAATHIYLRAYREGLLNSIRSFIRNELGLYEDKLIPKFDELGLQVQNSCGVAAKSMLPAANGDATMESAAGLVSAMDALDGLEKSGVDGSFLDGIRGRLLLSRADVKRIEDYREKEATLAAFYGNSSDLRSVEAGGPLASIAG